jgi:tetratricopeptide (TPR) repeat protein
MGEWFLTIEPSVLVRFGTWQEILRLPAPPENLQIDSAFWHYARGVALASTGHADRAREERQALNSAINAVPPGISGVLEIAADSLDARIAEAAGNWKEAVEDWKKAVARQDSLPYAEPPTWFYPVRESEGGALLQDRQFAAAETVFREDLRKNPGNPRSLFGLWKALEGEHRAADAARAGQEFERVWQHADVQLSVGAL